MYTYEDLVKKKTDDDKSDSGTGDSTDISKLRENLREIEPDYSTWQCVKDLVYLAVPTLLFFLTFTATQTINMVFINNSTTDEVLKKNRVNAIGIITLFIQVTITTLYASVLTAFDVIASNAYSLKRYNLLGLYFHKTQILTFSIIGVLSIFFYATGIKILEKVGIEQAVLIESEKYMHVFLIGLILDAQLSICVQFLNVVERSHINLYILGAMLLLHPLWSYIFIYVLQLGCTGAGISMVLTNLVGLIISNVYVYVIKPLPEAIFFFNANSFKNFWPYFKFVSSNAISLCLELWAIEIFGIVAVWIGRDDYVIYVIFTNVYQLTFSFTIGMGTAMLILISRNITHYHTKTIKKVIFTAMVISSCFMIFSAMLCAVFPWEIISFYIDDWSIVEKGMVVIRTMGIFIFIDFWQYYCGSILKGMGENFIPFMMILINYYVIQLTFVIVMGKVVGFGTLGITMGMAMGNFLTNITYLMLFIFYVDMRRYYLETIKRIDSEDLELPGEENKENDDKKEKIIIFDEEMCKINNKLS